MPLVVLSNVFLDSREIACTPTSRINGYDFSNQGLMGIWEGFEALPQPSEPRDTSLPSDSYLTPPAFDSSSASALGLPSALSRSFEDVSYGDFNVAINVILSRQGIEKQSWSPALRTNKLSQRELALQLCGWYLRGDELSDAIKKYGFCWSSFVPSKQNMQMGKGWTAVTCCLLAGVHKTVHQGTRVADAQQRYAFDMLSHPTYLYLSQMRCIT